MNPEQLRATLTAVISPRAYIESDGRNLFGILLGCFKKYKPAAFIMTLPREVSYRDSHPKTYFMIKCEERLLLEAPLIEAMSLSR